MRGCGRPTTLPGSSPLTRGKRCFFFEVGLAVGLIPAHAGKTGRDPCTSLAPPAHPRSRGENASSLDRRPSRLGSSPLTRGKPRIALVLGRRRRLIPAHAGKTQRLQDRRRWGAAHPRSRGENEQQRPSRCLARGSSPLTRGKRRTGESMESSRRLIPAHAGKTRHRPGGCCRGGAHPRSRGENVFSPPDCASVSGSSPLTRGKHFPTCAFTAQIDQILETLELAVSSGSYSVWVACATDAPQDQVRSIGLVLPSSRGAS